MKWNLKQSRRGTYVGTAREARNQNSETQRRLKFRVATEHMRSPVLEGFDSVSHHLSIENEKKERDRMR